MEVLGFSEFSQNLSPQGGDTEREKERWALRVRPRNSREGRSAQVYATSFLEKKKILHDGRPGVPHCLRIFILFYFFFFRYGTIHLLWRVRVLLHPKDLYGIWNRCGDYTPAAFDCRQGYLSRDNEERTR